MLLVLQPRTALCSFHHLWFTTHERKETCNLPVHLYHDHATYVKLAELTQTVPLVFP